MENTSTALLTDHYELTAVEAALASGLGAKPAVFELFARTLPTGRRYGVVAGTDRAVDAIKSFRFTPEQIDYVAERKIVGAETLEWLADFRFTGDVYGYRDGEIYFANSPVLTVCGTWAECCILETLLLSIFNFDSAVASAAARMDVAAGDHLLMEAGGRRTNEVGAAAAARAAYIAGFDVTSNLEAGFRYGIPTAGTVMHAFILGHETEEQAIAAQYDALGVDTTILVDTYDIPTCTRTAIRLANERGHAGPKMLRIDSGVHADEGVQSRKLLDDLGAAATKLMASGDLDEYRIEALVQAGIPFDGYESGTKVVTGSGHPTCGMVYKLVEILENGEWVQKAKKASGGKATTGGRKYAVRIFDALGQAAAELVTTDATIAAAAVANGGRNLQVQLITAGERTHHSDVNADREHHLSVRGELAPEALALTVGDPAIPTIRDIPVAELAAANPKEA